MREFFEAVRIQLRVISALILREVVTRYGREGLGFLWFFLEPILFIVVFTGIHYFMFTGRFDDVFVITFMLTGVSGAILWRNAVNRSIDAINANIGLFYHRYITYTDVILARIILEVLTVTEVFIILTLGLHLFDLVYKICCMYYVVIGWLMQIWFAVALSIFISSLTVLSQTVKRIWPYISLMLFIIGGTFYMVDWLPEDIKEYALLLPTVHNFELIRFGFFGSDMNPYFSIEYSFMFNITLTFLGLLSLGYINKHYEPV